ncbi:hypothetical protein MTO96_004897 [Rhipicephalus appendiculatus]
MAQVTMERIENVDDFQTLQCRIDPIVPPRPHHTAVKKNLANPPAANVYLIKSTTVGDQSSLSCQRCPDSTGRWKMDWKMLSGLCSNLASKKQYSFHVKIK